MIHSCSRRMKGNIKKYGTYFLSQSSGTAMKECDTSIITNKNTKGGRPIGATVEAKAIKNEKIDLAKDKISQLVYDAKLSNGGRLKRGEFQRIHDSVFHDLDLSIELPPVSWTL